MHKIPANDGLRTMTRQSHLYRLMIFCYNTCNVCTIISRYRSAGTELNFINVQNNSGPYNHSTVQVLYPTVISPRRRDFISQILVHNL
jgi:hypothetical protein